MKKIVALLILLFIVLASFGQQMTRSQLNTDIDANIYTNATHRITGDTLNHVLKKIVNSVHNILTDRKVDSIWRVAAKDSIYFSINGTHYQIKDSTSSGNYLSASDTLNMLLDYIRNVGSLSPLFTATETSHNVTFSLSNAGANTYFGNATGSAGAPSYTSAGALTKADDTNVTLTLGGNPATSLLRAASLTLGWTGQLAYSRGGTGASSFTNHGVVVAGASALTTVAPSTSGNVLTSNGTDWVSSAPTGGGSVVSVTDNSNGYVVVDNADPTNPIITFPLRQDSTVFSHHSTDSAFADVGDMDVVSDVIPGDLLIHDGDWTEIDFYGDEATGFTNGTITYSFRSNTCYTRMLTNRQKWHLNIRLMKDGGTTKVFCTYTDDSLSPTDTEYIEIAVDPVVGGSSILSASAGGAHLDVVMSTTVFHPTQ